MWHAAAGFSSMALPKMNLSVGRTDKCNWRQSRVAYNLVSLEARFVVCPELMLYIT